jgi:uncharacterized membrane protein
MDRFSAEEMTCLPRSIFEAWNSGRRDRPLDLDLVSGCRMLVEEVSMAFVWVRAPETRQVHERRAVFWVLVCCAIVGGVLTVAGFAQVTQPPPHTPRPLLLPEANRLPGPNEQMMMREKNAVRHNFSAANAERRKELKEASEMLETVAMALKAEVDKSEDVSRNTIHKAETIEKLARIVEDKMKLSVAPE